MISVKIYTYACVYKHTHNGTVLRHKKERNLAIAILWMDLQSIMLSEISQREKDKYYMLSHTEF